LKIPFYKIWVKYNPQGEIIEVLNLSTGKDKTGNEYTRKK